MSGAVAIKDSERVPCMICGDPTRMLGTKLCDRCWELKSRISRDPQIARQILALVDADRGARKRLYSFNVGGNVHRATDYINDRLPEFVDGIVQIDFSGNHSVVLFRADQALIEKALAEGRLT